MVWVIIFLIGLAAIATGMLSAVAGLGGGVILLVILAQFYAPTTAIPIQGGIQFVSNGSRSIMMREHINWPVAGWASILVLPASFLGVAVATSIPENAARVALGVFVLMATWRPTWLRWRSEEKLPPKAMVGVGAVSGFLNSTIGASGPFTSHFFKAATVSHIAFVATAGTSQILAHTSKLIAFTVNGFDFRDHLPLMAAGAAGTTLGTWLGGKLLDRADERHLTVVFNIVLTALALRLIVRGLF